MTEGFIYGHEFSDAREVIPLYLLLVKMFMGDGDDKNQRCRVIYRESGMMVWLVAFSPMLLGFALV